MMDHLRAGEPFSTIVVGEAFIPKRCTQHVKSSQLRLDVTLVVKSKSPIATHLDSYNIYVATEKKGRKRVWK